MAKKNSTKTVPELRFRGFTDPWEQRQLGEVAQFSKGQGYSKADLCSNGIPAFLYGQMYTDYKLLVTESGQYLPQNSDGVFSAAGDVIIPASGESPEEIAIASVIGKTGILLGGDLNIIKPEKSILDSIFLALSASGGRLHGSLVSRAQGKTIVHLHNSDIAASQIRFPTLPEQRRIGWFFATLDSLVAAAERQETLLRKKKQAYLQLMFPQEGETEPRLRFAGFSGEWEPLQLGELYAKNIERNGNQFDAEKTLSVSSMTFNASGNGAAEESLSTYKVLRIGDAAFEGHTSNEFAFGRFVVNTLGDGIMSPRFAAIRPTARWRESCDLDFWSYYLHDENVMKRILVRSTKRGTMMNELVLDDFFMERIRVPSLPEQRRIGDFFSALDNLIAATKQRTESLRALKSAYLQRMFV